MQVCIDGFRKWMGPCKFAGCDFEIGWRYAVCAEGLRLWMALCSLRGLITIVDGAMQVCIDGSVKKMVDAEHSS